MKKPKILILRAAGTNCELETANAFRAVGGAPELVHIAEIKAGTPSHVTASLTDAPRATNAEMRERMSGNICRCGAYSNILEAMTEVAETNA